MSAVPVVYPDDIAIAADQRAEILSQRMAEMFQRLEQDRDVDAFADGMGCVAEAIAAAILVERTRCSRIVLREALKRGATATDSAIAAKILSGEDA